MSEAERFIEQVGFAASLTDSRRPGPSLYIAVCGRRDAVMPRNVQKDPEASLTWTLKDEIVRRGKVYYAKLARGKAMFIAPRMVPYFHADLGHAPGRGDAAPRARHARPILRVLRREWEMATADLRDESGVNGPHGVHRGDGRTAGGDDRRAERGRSTCRSSPTSGRSPSGAFPRRCAGASSARRRSREIARCFLTGAGMTIPGELARVTGLSRPEAGCGNRALVAEGYATMPAAGTYHLSIS